MTASIGPLAGRSVLVTRPAHQCEGLAARLTEAGAEPVLLPTIEIESLADDPRLAAAVSALPRTDTVIFVSANAVAHAWPIIEAGGGLPSTLLVAAIGGATAEALRRHGVRDVVTAEAGADSEALLGVPAFTDVAGQRIAIFSGVGGRTLLRDTLRDRGADVSVVPCYVRRVPEGPVDDLVQRLAAARLDAVTITSAEGARNLFARLPAEAVRRLRLVPHVVNHARVAEAVRALGVTDITMAGTSDEALAEAVVRRLRPDGAVRTG